MAEVEKSPDETKALVEKSLDDREIVTDPLVYVQGRLVRLQDAARGTNIGDGRVEGK